MGISVEVVYQIYTVLMFVSCLANLVSVRIHTDQLPSQHCQVLLSMQVRSELPVDLTNDLQFYVFLQTVPQDAYQTEKFIRRFVKYFPLPRFALLFGCVAFCTALLFLGFATLTRWAAVVVASLIALTGIGLLAFFNHFRRLQRSAEYVLKSQVSAFV